MEKLETADVKKTLLHILLSFQKYCDQHELQFYLSAGTLLGAIRHQGFIPWDDDIDICIARPDYDKLLDLAKKNNNFGGHYKIECFFLGNSSYPFVKIIDTNTKIDPTFMDENETSSLFVDVFPVDALPTNETKINKIYKKAAMYRKILMLNSAKKGRGKTKLKALVKPLFIPLAKLIGVRWCNEQLDNLSRTYDFTHGKKVGSIMWGLYGPKEVMSHDKFTKSVDVTFEGHSFKTMSCWREYLTNMYGNYMEFPPKKDRRIHLLEAWKK